MSFNTQPPEGGWLHRLTKLHPHHLFQHTAARRRLDGRRNRLLLASLVSTHSRPKAAGKFRLQFLRVGGFQHTAARRRLGLSHSIGRHIRLFQHTAARRRLVRRLPNRRRFAPFQHTAARRRLGIGCSPKSSRFCFNTQPPEGGWPLRQKKTSAICGFNTQPPEGGWFICYLICYFSILFQHTAARRRLGRPHIRSHAGRRFQHTAARRRLGRDDAFYPKYPMVSTHSRPKAAGIILFL